MFTGIIEETGTLQELRGGRMIISARKVLTDVHLGDSIAVNGVCLTVTSFTGDSFCVDVMAETLRRSSLGSLRRGSRVNLERAMPANGRFGGHIVSGHIDDTGTIVSQQREGNAVWVTVTCGSALMPYIAEKGSIAIDGISLTVAALTADGFKVSIIPHTGAETTLLEKKSGDIVNLETDIIAKYVERLMAGGAAGTAAYSASGTDTFADSSQSGRAGEREAAGGITREFLQQNGF